MKEKIILVAGGIVLLVVGFLTATLINKKPDVDDKKNTIVVTMTPEAKEATETKTATVTVTPSVIPTNTITTAPTVVPTVVPTATPTIKPMVTLIKINPNIKLLPTIAPTPTSKYKVLSTPTPIKIYFP